MKEIEDRAPPTTIYQINNLIDKEVQNVINNLKVLLAEVVVKGQDLAEDIISLNRVQSKARNALITCINRDLVLYEEEEDMDTEEEMFIVDNETQSEPESI